MESLGSFDVVYSWGVLHHTRAMWDAIMLRQRAFGQAVNSLLPYNDQGAIRRYWRGAKRLYNRSRVARLAMIAAQAVLSRQLASRPGRERAIGIDRGMIGWYDLLDGLGGYPFEVATPHAITTFCGERGFRLVRAVTTATTRLQPVRVQTQLTELSAR